MENNKKYNGWTNYATWRVALEIFDGDGETWYNEYGKNQSQMAEAAEDYVQSILEYEGEGLAYDYAVAFVRSVNYFEIAEHIINDYHHYGCEHCGNPVEDIEDDFCSDSCKQAAINESIEERI